MNAPTYEWRDATKELPDDRKNVIVADSDGDVYSAFYDSGYGDGPWCYEGTEAPIRVAVEFWADFPLHPTKD